MFVMTRPTGYAPDMESITIHHPKLKLETVVPRSTLSALSSKGWKEGAQPKRKRGTKATTKEATA